MQTAHLETSDEATLAINSVQDRIFSPSVENVVNAWNTFGPLGGDTPLMTTVLRYRLFNQAVTGVAPVAYPGDGVLSGHIVTIFVKRPTICHESRISSCPFFLSPISIAD